jgi:hypothetical protein
MSEERRAKHSLEIKIIEVKDQQSEMFLKNRCIEDDYEKAAQEVSFPNYSQEFDQRLGIFQNLSVSRLE